MGTLVELARRLRPLIVRAAQNLEDHEAVVAPQLYEAWMADAAYEAGVKCRRNGRVWRARQAHTSQATWTPENTPALWEEICVTHTGAADDPIPYAGNMALSEGLYYVQAGAVYLCTRSTGVPVVHPLAELVGLYVLLA